jgi:hypothetical protein
VMADYTANLDGEMTLEQTEQRCEIEQNAGFQLQRIKFGTIIEEGTVLQVNTAEFMSKPVGRLKNLSFINVGTQDPAKIRTDKEADGWTFICDCQIYVENHVTKALVFGKKTL